MGFAEALYARANAHAGLKGLIGTPPRLYPVTEGSQNAATPYVTYQVVSEVPTHVMTRDSLAHPRVQFDCWADSRTAARAVAAQVVACYDRQQFTDGGSTSVLASICEQRGLDVETDDVTKRPRVLVEFAFTYGLP